MNPLIQRKQMTRVILLVLLFACFGLSVRMQAVVPPPDGGYPGSNTAEGQSALSNLTSGTLNTAVGASSLRSVTNGGSNTGVGAVTLYFNTANENTATGAGALFLNTTGSTNTAIGAFALLSNTTGDPNTAIGDRALFSNTIARHNTACGYQALYSTTGGENGGGGANTAVGSRALHNTNGNEVFAGGANTAVGFDALYNNTTGSANVAVGAETLYENTGYGNTAVGSQAGLFLTTGDYNIDIANPGVAGESDTIRIGDRQAATYVAGISGQTASGGVAVYVNSDGKLGTSPSSSRFKDEIKPLDRASEVIFALKPVTFRYKKEFDGKAIRQFGLVAEDVDLVNPDLVARDRDGKPYSVRYDQINAMLLNEFIKEHKKVQEQGATIIQQRKDFEAALAQQQKQIEAITAALQKMSAQLELNKPAPQTVLNNR